MTTPLDADTPALTHAAAHTPATRPSDTAAPFIAADVGGTHARVALVRSDGVGGVTVLHHATCRCADWPTLDAIVDDFLRDPIVGAGRAPERAVLACAGRLHGDDLINTNLPWTVSMASLRKRLQLRRIDVINDFEALAHAVPTVTAEDSRHLIGPDRRSRPVDAGTVVVMGPGTGLGCAAVLHEAGGRHRVLASEAGHVALAAGTAREAAVIAWLAQLGAPGAAGDTHVAVERVLSGPGLVATYRALAGIDGGVAHCTTPSEVSAAAIGGSDALAVEAVQMFCTVLGSVCADLALLYGATGGVLLAGGVLPALDGPLRDGRFEARFLAKGVLRPWLSHVPVRLIDHGLLAVVGAARWSLGGP